MTGRLYRVYATVAALVIILLPPSRADMPGVGFPPQYEVTDLGTLGGNFSQANAINDKGEIVGVSKTGSGKPHAFLYRAGRMHDLGTLGGKSSRANDINDKGQIVGDSGTRKRGVSHAVLWSGGKMTDLGTLGGDMSHAAAINTQGQIVGESSTTKGL